jgi:hypothetical protein
MKAYLDLWAISDEDKHNVDARAVLAAVRAVPGVVRADWFYTPDDLIAIVETDADDAFEEAVNRIEAIPDCSVAGVRMVRGT